MQPLIKENILFLGETGRPKSPQESSTDPPISTSTPRSGKSATVGAVGKSATVVTLATQEDDGEFGSETDDFAAPAAVFAAVIAIILVR